MGAKEEFIEKLEGKGEGTVRGEVATYTTSHKRWANSWLAEIDHQRLLRMEALDTKTLDLARSTKVLASSANILASATYRLTSKTNLIAKKALKRATIAAIAAIVIAAATMIAAAVTVISFSSN